MTPGNALIFFKRIPKPVSNADGAQRDFPYPGKLKVLSYLSGLVDGMNTAVRTLGDVHNDDALGCGFP